MENNIIRGILIAVVSGLLLDYIKTKVVKREI